jgi:HD-GYP domain-containing protein (c-di-GMP phosphodiesterase class II)
MRTPQYDLFPLLQKTNSRTPEQPLEAAWEILDRYAQALQAEADTSSQIRLSLRAVRDGLRADAVYWDPGPGQETPMTVGRADLSAGWCQALTSQMLKLMGDEDEDGQLLRTNITWGDGAITPAPVSVAMVRVSRSLKSWIVSVSFTPGRQFRPADLKMMSLARRLLLNQRHNIHVYSRLRESLFGLVRCLTAAIEAKDPYTCGHSERVARIGMRIGAEMGLPESELGDIYLAGLLHDIGKIGVRDDILMKPGALTAEEMAHVQQHALIGDRLISSIRQLDHLRPGVRNHHERFDGKGYPDCLAAEQIPLMARVLAVADSCDAMMSERPYREAMPASQIETIMLEGAGKMWDPVIIDHFMACRHNLYTILQRGLGDSVAVAVGQAIAIHPDAVSILSPRRRK